MALDDFQQNLAETTASGSTAVFITGSAGTGKSTVLRQVISALDPKKTLICAPTGVASVNVGGTTLHSALGLKPGAEAGAATDVLWNSTIARKLQKCENLIIDEVSMLSPMMMSATDAVLRRYKRCERPFGGVRAVFCGDFMQLPPVDPPVNGIKYCFQTDVWRDLQVKPSVLQRSYRQTQPELTQFLSEVRSGKWDSPLFADLSKKTAPASAVKLRATNREVDHINDAEYARLRDTDEFVSEAICTGQSSEARFQVIPKTVKLKRGARVMLLRNLNVRTGLVNGATGEVTGFDVDPLTDERTPLVAFDSLRGVHKISRAEWTGESLGKTIWKVSQVPLRPAWAVTIHKAQGATIPVVDVDLSNAFDYGQAYVALSRASSLEGLIVRGASARTVRMCPISSAFDRQLRDESPHRLE